MNPKQPEQQAPREIAMQGNINGLPPFVQHMWYLASCMEIGRSEMLQLGSNRKSGMTRQELKDLESHCGNRVTLGERDPAIFVRLERGVDGGASLKIMRWSDNLKTWDIFFELKGDNNTLKGEMTFPNREALKNNILPVLKKLADVGGELVKFLTRNGPNQILYRQYFDTHPKGAYWAQLTSPNIKDQSDAYRLYVNPEISALPKYEKIVKEIVKKARSYAEPLNFKFMFCGSEAQAVIKDPDSSKIVFYFKDKEAAVRFGDHLSRNLDDKLFKSNDKVPLKERFVPQRTWRNGLLILGKGTREARRAVVRQLGVQDIRSMTRQRLLDKAKALSITV